MPVYPTGQVAFMRGKNRTTVLDYWPFHGVSPTADYQKVVVCKVHMGKVITLAELHITMCVMSISVHLI